MTENTFGRILSTAVYQWGNHLDQMVSEEIDSRIEEKVTEKVTEALANPPPWFHEGINSIREDLSAVKEDLSAVKEDLSAVKEDLSAVKEDLSAVKEDLSAVKEDLSAVKEDLSAVKEDLNSFKTEVHTRFDALEKKVDSGNNLSEYRYACLLNMQRRTSGRRAVTVPFLNREIPQDELPPISSVEDIDRLNKSDCQKYLRAYNISYGHNETIKLKERLRDAVGLESAHDVEYSFRGFS